MGIPTLLLPSALHNQPRNAPSLAVFQLFSNSPNFIARSRQTWLAHRRFPQLIPRAVLTTGPALIPSTILDPFHNIRLTARSSQLGLHSQHQATHSQQRQRGHVKVLPPKSSLHNYSIPLRNPLPTWHLMAAFTTVGGRSCSTRCFQSSQYQYVSPSRHFTILHNKRIFDFTTHHFTIMSATAPNSQGLFSFTTHTSRNSLHNTLRLEHSPDLHNV